MLARSLLTIACRGCLLALFAVPGAQAQSPAAPTPYKPTYRTYPSYFRVGDYTLGDKVPYTFR